MVRLLKKLSAKQNIHCFVIILLSIIISGCNPLGMVDSSFGSNSPTTNNSGGGYSNSSPKDITTFSILGINGAIVGSNITVTLPYGTNVNSLTPTIIQTGSSVNPVSGVAQNFASPVTYTVTASDGTTKNYTITVTVSANNAKEVTTFSILGMNGAIIGQNITVTLPYGTSLASLTPTIVTTGASINPASGVAQNFADPVTYTVTAANGSTKDYTVTATVSANNAKDITTFSILGINGAIVGQNITVTVPYGTSLASLTPTIVQTGASVIPASGVARNFTNYVTYTVTAADGTTKDYAVTVTVSANSAKDITTFSILGINGEISGSNITVTLPYGTSRASLTPTIVQTGSSINPASGVAQNFTSPVTYTVIAADGTTKEYTVTVTVSANSAKDITTFSIGGINGAIEGTDISLTLPYGTSLASLTPSIVTTGSSVSPANGVAQNFADPVTYTVTAANGSTKDYTVTATVSANNAKDITTFSILGINGAIVGQNITITLPYGTNVSSLTPTIVDTGTSINPSSGVAQNFTKPITYTVTAADDTTKEYTVTAVVSANSAKEITNFSIYGVNGAIIGQNITINLPYGTSLTSLTPTIVQTGASVSPASGVAHNFTNPVTYTVTAADGTTNSYFVTATVSANSSKEITGFSILGANGLIVGQNISVAVPYGTPSLTSLTPTIVHTGASVSPASGVAQNFTNPMTYTVTASDGTTNSYLVTVSVAPNPLITGFTIPNELLWTTIDNTTNTITLTMPYLTNLTSLTPTITTSTGGSVSPASGVAQNFTNPVYYIVSVGNSMKMYEVIVTTSPYMPAGYPASFSAGGVSFNMYYVPGGLTFKAGTDDSTPTTITNAYWIAETSVTYELWSTVYNWATSHGYTFANAGRKGNAGTGNVTQPVTVINWRDTMIWMNALTEWYNAINGTQYTCAYYSDAGYTTPIRTATNSTTITSTTLGSQDDPYVLSTASGFRMLSSAEWELAARYKGSNSTSGAYEWPVGSGNWWTKGTYASGATADYTNASATQAVGWDVDNSGAASHDVKLKAPNTLALYDMSGNVWQWSFDWYTSGSSRIMRGGSWYNPASSMQVGYVSTSSPYSPGYNFGFRFARTNL